MNGVEIVTSSQSPSGKQFALADGTSPDNSDVVPAGQGPSNLTGATSITQINDTNWYQLNS